MYPSPLPPEEAYRQVAGLQLGSRVPHEGGVDWAALVAQLQRLEDKVDLLLECLAEQVDPADTPVLTLDGTPAGQERAQGLSLDL